MTLTEFRRIESSLGPEACVWHPDDGWLPVWLAFAPPEGEESTNWPSGDPDAPPPPPPHPPSDVAEVTQDKAESPHGSGGINRRALIITGIAVLVGGVLLAVGIGTLMNQSGTAGLAGSASQATTPPSAAPDSTSADGQEDIPVEGYWTGTMASGRYRFEMVIRERSDNTLRARMTQTDRETGYSGTEFLSGRRSADEIRLKGYRWSLDTPPGWSLDTIAARIYQSADAYRLSGTYTCPTCSGAQGISPDAPMNCDG